MDFDKKIEEIAQKYNYNDELASALKRCIPVMAKGKSDEEVELLIATLDRVPIIEFDERPTFAQLEELKKNQTNGKNQHVKTIDKDQGEYGKTPANGAYHSIPIFDEKMNLVDRVGYIHLTKLDEYSKCAEAYGTKVNFSHLVHELGHAWAAQKDEYAQAPDGTLLCSVGASFITYNIDRENNTIATDRICGRYIEEALNTLEEEKVLCDMLNIQNVREIPEYLVSAYQGMMRNTMVEYVQKIGEEPFSKLRHLKDNNALAPYQKILDKTDATAFIKSDAWTQRKRKTFERIEDLEVPEENKEKLREFFSKYDEVYFPKNREQPFWANLDNVLNQQYSFGDIKYQFGIENGEKNLDIYKGIITEIARESGVPLAQAENAIKTYNRNKELTDMER